MAGLTARGGMIGIASGCRPQVKLCRPRASVCPSFRACSIHTGQQQQQQQCRGIQRAGIVMHAAADDDLAAMDDPDTAQEANDQGLRFTGAGRWADALSLFERALGLPGTGIKRFRDKPRGASDRERMTSLYNIACCHAQLNDVRSGLVALLGCLEAGYADWPQLRSDPDLAPLRTDERFESLMKRFEPSGMAAMINFDLTKIFDRK